MRTFAFVPRQHAVALTVVALLSACGGGGGSAGADNQAPVVVAAVSGEAILNATTSFDTTGTRDPEGGALTRSWSYGDGSIGTQDTHVYSSAGSFTAVYTARDDQGASASRSINVTVTKCSAEGTRLAALSPYPTVCIRTSAGELVTEVFPAQAPLSAANFLKYVDDGFYAGTLFHRVIKGFVVQAGGYTSGLAPKAPIYAPIALESNNGLQNREYTLAMARTNVPNSATSQFYVNLVDNPSLNYSAAVAGPNGYAVFGKVISGTAVVDAIGNVATGTVSGSADVPLQEVVIRSAVRLP